MEYLIGLGLALAVSLFVPRGPLVMLDSVATIAQTAAKESSAA